ncbi:hypothetical protein SAMN02787074_0797 [Chryseobacterium sp. YR221]|nr:hypothetical protein SAMN02787074_0797 [Chryseobacterium sp. YR221]
MSIDHYYHLYLPEKLITGGYENRIMLTGKAKTDFDKWMKDEIIFHPDTGFNSLADKFQTTLIIEWLDSVFIVLTINNTYYDAFHFYWELNMAKPLRSDQGFATGQLATISAIEKANEIYNSRP